MFSYIMLGTNDPQASYKFYAPLMRVLGHPLDGRSEKGAAWGTFKDNHTTGLCVGMPFDNLPATRGNGVMVALNAVSVDMVQELYRLAIENGGEDEGPPDYRPHYGADFIVLTYATLTKTKSLLFFMTRLKDRIPKTVSCG